MPKHLIIAQGGDNMLFSFESSDVTIDKAINPGTIYSKYFTGIDVHFFADDVLVNGNLLEDNNQINIDETIITVHKDVQFSPYKIENVCIISSDANNADITLPVSHSIIIERKHNTFSIESQDSFFLNGIKQKGKFELSVGDYLLIENELILITENGIKVRARLNPNLARDYSAISKVNPKAYHRSPRLFHVYNEDPVVIENPPNKPNKQDRSLAKIIIPPIVMLSITVTISILMGRGLFIVISIMATLMATINSVQTYIDNRSKFKRETAERITKYQDYLTEKSVEINLRIQEETRSSNYKFLAPDEIIDLVSSESRRIFERSNKDSDFLNVRIGSHSRTPMFEIKLPERKLNEKFDELYEDARELRNNFKITTDAPLDIDLKEANVGIIGTKQLSVLLAQQILLELMTFHSYHDLQLLTIFNDDTQDLEWLAYAPHSKIEAINARGLIYNDILRDQILGSFVQILKNRETKYKQDNKIAFAPHYVVTIVSSDLIHEHSIAEYVSQDIRHLGVSIITLENEHENLKENISTVIEIYSKHRSKLLINEGEYVKQDFTALKLPSAKELVSHSRRLQGFNHILKSESGLPSTITFMEMFEVDTTEQLQIARRWKQSDSTKSLAVRLGVNGDNFVELNLHEKAHGPHGLVAGTTGSGKSEIVQSYILSLAVNFSPHEVAFLLIDYKGGGMANLFKDLPHLIGTITNLDGDASMRALVSIKSELLRRQEIFSKYNVNHINQYIHLFKEGTASEPMPHLFLISDEFAELKSEQPEFMAELVSTARIGRSLGIHLILATQKPSGVVDSQIWSNSKFKLCLKVQDESDSKEMLKTADAAHIVEPGRAYLQVGNNEVYELFQSAWSGADYNATKQAKQVDNRIYQINQLGQYSLLTKDLSGINEEIGVQKADSELEAVVKATKETFEQENLQSVAPIWLEDLLESYALDDYLDIDFSLNTETITLGIVDMPSKQKQVIYEKTLLELGNAAVIGSSGYGKSYTLMTMLLSLFTTNSAESLYAYIIDFGNNSLINMRELPHVAEYISIDDNDKLDKFMKIISEEITDRKRKFSQAGANHISVYNGLVSEQLPKIVISLDNFDVLRDEFPELEDFIIKTTRDCTSLGIHYILTASRSSAFRTVMANNLRTKIALYNTDGHEYASMVGKSEFKPKDRSGNALVKYDDIVAVMQIFKPAKAETDVEMVRALTDKVEDIKTKYTGATPSKIAVVSEELTANQFLAEYPPHEDELYIGIDYETVEPISIKLDDFSVLPIISSPSLGKSNFASFAILQKIPNAIVVAKDKTQLNVNMDDHDFINISEMEEAIKTGKLKGKVLIIDNLAHVFDNISLYLIDALVGLLDDGKLKIITGFNSEFVKQNSGDLITKIKTTNIAVIQAKPENQNIVSIGIREASSYSLKLGDAIYSIGENRTVIKVPKV